jgi:hypothetical protein
MRTKYALKAISTPKYYKCFIFQQDDMNDENNERRKVNRTGIYF